MHSLVWKQLEVPKELMDKERQDHKDTDGDTELSHSNALINNVHQGYVNFDEEDEEDQSSEKSSQPEESLILRQWRRKKKLELEARQRESLDKQDRILEQAAIERENFYKDREARIEAKKRLNRESETKYHSKVESNQKLVEGNLWEAVAALIDLNGEIDRKAANRSEKSPKSSIVELSTPKKIEQNSKKIPNSPKPVKKTTDLSRMREVLG